MMKTNAVLIALALAAIPAAASAKTYDVAVQPVATATPFQYGSGTVGVDFHPFSTFASSGCFGASALACAGNSTSQPPTVVFNTSASPVISARRPFRRTGC